MQRISAVAALLLALGAFPLPARAQSSSLQELLSGDAVSLHRPLRELDEKWRRITLAGPVDPQGDGGGLGFMGMMMGAMFGGGPAMAIPGQVYYTQGKTISAGTETYLIAYRPERKPVDMGLLMRMGPNPGNLPAPEKLTPESRLVLALVNLRSINSISEIRPFELGRELAESQKAAEQAENARKQMMEGFGGAPDVPVAEAVEAEMAPKPQAAPRSSAKPTVKSAPKPTTTRRRR